MTDRVALEQKIERELHNLLRLSTDRRSPGRMLQIKEGIRSLDLIWAEYRDSVEAAFSMSGETTVVLDDGRTPRQVA